MKQNYDVTKTMVGQWMVRDLGNGFAERFQVQEVVGSVAFVIDEHGYEWEIETTTLVSGLALGSIKGE